MGEEEVNGSFCAAIEQNLAVWAREIQKAAAAAPPDGGGAVPDLFGFYEELCALRHEIRTSGRRTQEAFNRFGEIMAAFDAALGALRKSPDAQPAAQNIPDLPRLLDLAEGMERLETHLACKPTGLFLTGRPWQKYAELFSGAFQILKERFDGYLQGLGIRRMQVMGSVFDPRRMFAVGWVARREVPEGTVAEEVSPGYLMGEQVLKYAEVRLAKNGKDDI